MLEDETAARYEAEFDRLFRASQLPEAEKQALDYLNWAWREFKRPQRYTATAQTLLARIAQQGGYMALAFWQTFSARSILSGYERMDERQVDHVRYLDQNLIELAQANKYDVMATEEILRNAANGFRLYSNYKREGDSLLESNPKEAIKAYDAALSYYPLDPLVLVNRAAAKLESRDFDGHARDLSDALLIYADDPVARYNRAQIYVAAKRWQQALDDLNVAIGTGAEASDYYALRAEVYEGMGEVDKALADYRVALERAGGDELKKDIERRAAKLQHEMDKGIQ